MTLSRFVYMSQARLPLGAADLLHLRLSSEKWNDRNQITGMLLFDGTRFAQLIEGPDGEVASLARRILGDLRHDGIDVKEHGSCTGRQFEGWSLRSFAKQVNDPPNAFRHEVTTGLKSCTDQVVAAFFRTFVTQKSD